MDNKYKNAIVAGMCVLSGLAGYGIRAATERSPTVKVASKKHLAEVYVKEGEESRVKVPESFFHNDFELNIRYVGQLNQEGDSELNINGNVAILKPNTSYGFTIIRPFDTQRITVTALETIAAEGDSKGAIHLGINR